MNDKANCHEARSYHGEQIIHQQDAMSRVETNKSCGKSAAIVLGLGINGLGVARCLGRRGVPVFAVTRDDPRSSLSASRYLRQVWWHAPDTGSIVDTLLGHTAQFEEPPVLFPTSDAMVLELAARRQEVTRHCRIRLPDANLIAEAMSKRGFASLTARLELPAPRTFVVDNDRQLQRVAAEIDYPCVVKPDFQTPEETPHIALKVEQAHDAAELARVYRKFCPTMPTVVVQEWIPGSDCDVLFCLQYYGCRRVPLASFCGRKIRQYPPLYGNTSSCEPIDYPEMERITTDFFSQIGIEGLCSMEFKRDPRNGALLMVEPTIGRTDHQSGVADINGVPIPYVAYCDQVDRELPRIQKRHWPVRWVRWSADRAAAKHYMRRGELNLFGFLWSLRPPVRFAVWSLRDPAPSWRILKSHLLRKVRALWPTMPWSNNKE